MRTMVSVTIFVFLLAAFGEQIKGESTDSRFGGGNNPGYGGGNYPEPGFGGGNNNPNPGFGGGNHNPNPGFGGGNNNQNPGFGGGNKPDPGFGGGNYPNPGFGGGNYPNPGFGGGNNNPNPGFGGGNSPGFGGGNGHDHGDIRCYGRNSFETTCPRRQGCALDRDRDATGCCFTQRDNCYEGDNGIFGTCCCTNLCNVPRPKPPIVYRPSGASVSQFSWTFLSTLVTMATIVIQIN